MKKDRVKIHQKYIGKCAYCGDDIDFKSMQVDHIIPQGEFKTHIKNNFMIPEFLKHLTESDVNHIDNLNPTCRICNKWKSNYHLEAFRKELSQQVRRLNEYSANFRMAKKYDQITEIEKPIVFYFEKQ